MLEKYEEAGTFSVEGVQVYIHMMQSTTDQCGLYSVPALMWLGFSDQESHLPGTYSVMLDCTGVVFCERTHTVFRLPKSFLLRYWQ